MSAGKYGVQRRLILPSAAPRSVDGSQIHSARRTEVVKLLIVLRGSVERKCKYEFGVPPRMCRQGTGRRIFAPPHNCASWNYVVATTTVGSIPGQEANIQIQYRGLRNHRDLRLLIFAIFCFISVAQAAAAMVNSYPPALPVGTPSKPDIL